MAGDEGYLSLVSDGLIGGRKWLDGGGSVGREKREGGPREGGRRKAKYVIWQLPNLPFNLSLILVNSN